MKKDAYYFSHDYNAHNDVKILFLRQQLGMEGYGIYWFLVETLAESGGILPLKIVPVLAMQMQVSEIKVKAVIESFDLFQIIEDSFFSQRLINHLEMRKLASENGKKGAKEKWKNRVANGVANGMAIGDANAKERKGKERKVNEINIYNGKKYLNSDFNDLPEQYIISSIEQIKIQKQQTITKDQVQKLWETFKLEKLVGEDFYTSESKVYQYFVNWIKKQKFEKNETRTNQERTIDAYNQFLDRYR
jgi:hypothetical protein